WNPSSYGDIKEIHLADHEVWQPDVFPYNSATGSTIDHYGNTNLIAYFNGTVIWVPPSIFQVFCQMDFTNWPFDSQTCSLKIGSWTYNGEQVDLFNSNHMQTLPNLVPNSEWEFVKMTVKRNSVYYPCCPIPYTDVTFELTIQRHSATYKALIITPVSGK
ncbi:Acetylcholine receptor protein subunit alpha, putative, partial [Pediculus humanus corporis]